jgi:hypothetical protein
MLTARMQDILLNFSECLNHPLAALLVGRVGFELCSLLAPCHWARGASTALGLATD